MGWWFWFSGVAGGVGFGLVVGAAAADAVVVAGGSVVGMWIDVVAL